jgi:hypothetical protein
MRGLAPVAAMLVCTTSLTACQRLDSPRKAADNQASSSEAATNESVAEELNGVDAAVGEDANVAFGAPYGLEPAELPAPSPSPKMSGPPSEPFITGTPPPPPPPNSR